MHIACSINKNFIQHMCVMLQSLTVHTREEVSVHILYVDLSPEDEQFIKYQFEENDKVTLFFYKVSTEKINNIPIVPESLTIETLFRLLLPIELPSTVEKVLYIDSDIVIKDDVWKIYQMDLEGHYLAAVVDVYEVILKTIQFDDILNYFNAGFLLIDLKKWREDRFFEKCIDFANKYPDRIVLADQDVLNGALNGNWKRLPLKWNVVRNFIYSKESYYKYFSKEEIEEAINNPSIIHYSSAQKPWDFFDKHPYKEEYFKYLDQLKIEYDRNYGLKLIKDKKVVLFGTGGKAVELSSVFAEFGVKIDYYTDNNPEKWNTFFNGKKVINPDLLRKNSEDYFVFVASQYLSEISSQLVAYGFTKSWEGFTYEMNQSRS